MHITYFAERFRSVPISIEKPSLFRRLGWFVGLYVASFAVVAVVAVVLRAMIKA